MTTYRVAELTGALLDAAVAKADGLRFVVGTNRAGDMPLAYVFTERRTDEYPDGQPVIYDPSQSWGRGGTIIEREQIGIDKCYDEWCAAIPAEGDKNADGAFHEWGTPAVFMTGPTPLTAAMRAFVSVKLGETIDL